MRRATSSHKIWKFLCDSCQFQHTAAKGSQVTATCGLCVIFLSILVEQLFPPIQPKPKIQKCAREYSLLLEEFDQDSGRRRSSAALPIESSAEFADGTRRDTASGRIRKSAPSDLLQQGSCVFAKRYLSSPIRAWVYGTLPLRTVFSRSFYWCKTGQSPQ